MKKNKKQYRYVHLLLVNELKFISRVVNTINASENGFCREDHIFVTPHVNVYDALKEYGNVILDAEKTNLYKKYAKCSHWIFSHGSISKWQWITTPKRVLKKVLYRYWGGSLVTLLKPDPKHPVSYIKDKLRMIAFKRMYGSFAAIGVANITDIIDLSRVLKKANYYAMPYAVAGGYEAIAQAKGKKEDDGYLNVLLGHRGTAEDNHIALLETLRKFPTDKIKIYVPLSYGDKEYIENVTEYVNKNAFENVIIVSDFLGYSEYIDLLNRMDIAILDGLGSYALGNVAILLSLGKTIYLNSEGIVKEAFDKVGIPCKLIDALANQSFEDFCSLIDYTPYEGNELEMHDYPYYIEKWKEILADFE